MKVRLIIINMMVDTNYCSEAQTEAARKQRKRQAMKVPLPLSSIVSGEASPEVRNSDACTYFI